VTVQWEEVDGEVIAVDRRNSRYLGANRTATVLWRLLVGGATLPELAGALTNRWGIDEALATRDAEALVRSLQTAGLIVTETR
jgi:hypothetical protein